MISVLLHAHTGDAQVSKQITYDGILLCTVLRIIFPEIFGPGSHYAGFSYARAS